VLNEWRPPEHTANLVYAPNRYVSARLRAFIEWSAELFRVHPLLKARDGA
jgi:LysR family transcriptional regulator, regulator for bpeEF and oprC